MKAPFYFSKIRADFLRNIKDPILSCILYGAAAPIPDEELEDALDRVVHDRDFAWRMPPVESDEPKSLLVKLLDSISDGLKKMLLELAEFIEEIVLSFRSDADKGDWLGNMLSGGKFLTITVILIAVLTAFLLWRHLKNKSNDKLKLQRLDPIKKDVESIDSLSPSEILESEWHEIGQGFLRSGDYKSAVRAIFIASIAILSKKEIIVLRKSKTNREYSRELRRKLRRAGDAGDAFNQSLSFFEMVCYGNADPDREMAEACFRNYEKFKALSQ